MHTLGPWKAEPSENVPGFWRVGPADGDVVYVTLRPESVGANARLIAAAPDLLRALRQVVELFGMRDPHDDEDGLLPAHRQLPEIAAALAAIAKAEAA